MLFLSREAGCLCSSKQSSDRQGYADDDNATARDERNAHYGLFACHVYLNYSKASIY